MHIWQVFDESALSQRCKEEMYKCYPDAKRAHLKSGGNFPYLSRSSEVDLMVQVGMYMEVYVLVVPWLRNLMQYHQRHSWGCILGGP